MPLILNNMKWFAALLLTFGYSDEVFSEPLNVLFLISDDLTYTALSCYGNEVCRTPNIDKLAAEGTRFTEAYCQGTYCGPSRASFMSGYYPHATGVLGYTSPRSRIGDRSTWSQHRKDVSSTSRPSDILKRFASATCPHC